MTWASTDLDASASGRRTDAVSVEIGTGQTVEMPAAGQQGVLEVTCASCGETSVHHVGWFDPPAGDDRWTVRTVGPAAVGDADHLTTDGSTPNSDQLDSPRYNDR